MFSVIIFLNRFSSPFSFSSPSGSPIKCSVSSWWCLISSLINIIFSFLVSLLEFHCPVFEFMDQFFQLIWSLVKLFCLIFQFTLWYSSALRSLFGISSILCLCLNSQFVHALLSWLQWAPWWLIFWTSPFSKSFTFVSLRSVSEELMFLYLRPITCSALS